MNKKELIDLVDEFMKRKLQDVCDVQGKEELRMKNKYVDHLRGVKSFQAAYEAFDSALTAMANQIPAMAQDRYIGIFNFIDQKRLVPSAKDIVMDGIKFSQIAEFRTMYDVHSDERDAIRAEHAKVTAHCKTLRDGKEVRKYLLELGFSIPDEGKDQLPMLPVDTTKLF